MELPIPDDQIIAHIGRSILLTLPLLILIATGLLLLVADVFVGREKRHVALPGLAIGGMVAALLALIAMRGSGIGAVADIAFSGAMTLTPFTVMAQMLCLAIGIFVCVISMRYISTRSIPAGEYYMLLVFAVAGMMALSASTDLLALFLNLELLSITLYILAGMEKNDSHSSEAAFKYFLLGSFAAAFLLLGIAFTFGGAGELHFASIAKAVDAGAILNPAFLTVGIALIFIGFAFKLSLAPFHMYAPDVYEGSPTPIAALIATGTKVAGFAALFNLVETLLGWDPIPVGLWAGLYGVVVISAIYGNLGAVVQPSLKRMLAYSSIAHSGYTIIPIVVLLRAPELVDEARTAIGFYLLAYSLMTLVAFGVAASLERNGNGSIRNLAGLWRRKPMLAVIMLVALISLLGMPPTLGFLGKFALFQVAVAGGHFWMAGILFVASAASAYYYLRVTVTMFMEEPAEEVAEGEVGRFDYLALGLGCAAMFIGLIPAFYTVFLNF